MRKIKDEDCVMMETQALRPVSPVEKIKGTEVQARARPNTGRSSMSHLNLTKDLSQIDESGDFSSESFVKNAIKLSYRLYELDGIVANTIDTFVEFCITDLKFNGIKNKTLEDCLEYWARNVNSSNPTTERSIRKWSEYTCLQLHLAGNVFFEGKWTEEKVRLSSGKSRNLTLPSSIFFYDPSTVNIDAGMGNTLIYVGIQKNLSNAITFVKKHGRTKFRMSNKFNKELKSLVLNLPDSVFETMRSNSAGNSEIALNTIISLQRKKAPFNIWGTPYTTRAFKNLSIKMKLQSLDIDTIDGIINYITIFKVGTKEHPAKQARLNAFRSLLESSSATNSMVWGHDIDAVTVGPKDKLIDIDKRYAQINADILEDLGLPKAFTGSGSFSSDGDAWAQILRLMERISTQRKTISRVIEDWAEQIAEKNGFKKGKDYTDIKVEWKRNNLMNPKDIREFVVQLYDRGLISKTTAAWLTDNDINQELITRANEKSLKIETEDGEFTFDELIAPPQLPFSKNEYINKDTDEENGRPKEGDINKNRDVVKDDG